MNTDHNQSLTTQPEGKTMHLRKKKNSCHKVGHVTKNCRTQTPIPKNEHVKGKGKVDVEKKKREMIQTWKKKVEARSSGTSEVKITQSNGDGNYTTSN